MNAGTQSSRVIAFAVLEEWGGLFSTLRVARELRRRGHRVLYLVRPLQRYHDDASNIRHPDHFRRYLEEAGFEVRVVPIPSLPSRTSDRARSYKTWFHELLDLTKSLLQELQVDLLLLQPPASFPFSLPALDLGIPTVLLNPHFGDFTDLRVPPIHSSRMPPTSPWSFALNALAWFQAFLRHQVRRHTRPVVLLSYLSGSQRVARDLLRRHRLVLRFTGNRLYVDLPMMKIGPREFDLVPGPPATYLGANVDLERPEPAFSWDPVVVSRTLIYCSLGEYGDRMAGARRFFGTVLRVAASRPDLQFVIATGNLDLQEMGEVPANVTWSRWVPQLDALRKSSLAITSAGFGTIKECIAMGVPLVVVPFTGDQPGNAARVVYHGLGVQADRRVSRRKLEELIDHVLTSDSIRARVERMKPHFLTEEPLVRGVDLLERIIRDDSEIEVLSRRSRRAGLRAAPRGVSASETPAS